MGPLRPQKKNSGRAREGTAAGGTAAGGARPEFFWGPQGGPMGPIGGPRDVYFDIFYLFLGFYVIFTNLQQKLHY